ncbi:MAG: hypothetical protein R3B83_05915 [Nitrospirales bacterium]|nr:hypothetical protein [Nitrospirales bacterium]
MTARNHGKKPLTHVSKAYFIGGIAGHYWPWKHRDPMRNGNQAMSQGSEPTRQSERDWMVNTQIIGGGITDTGVIGHETVPRHESRRLMKLKMPMEFSPTHWT